MDFEILQFMVAVSVIFLYLYIQNTKMISLAIISGVLFVLTGIPLVAGGTLNYVECEGLVVNVTDITDHCFREAVAWTWGLQEAMGCMFILIGLGIVISIHDAEVI